MNFGIKICFILKITLTLLYLFFPQKEKMYTIYTNRFMKHTKLFYAFIAIFAVSMFASCQKDDNTPINTPENPEESEVYYVLSHDTFLDEDDVEIISADTTSISVSKDYLDQLGYDFKASEENPIPVTIWRTINTAPFVRNIVATEEDGNRVILTTKSGDIGDVFGNADFNLDTQIYVDHSQPQMVTRSGRIVENWDRYTDDDGVIHPAIIILDSRSQNDALPAGATTPTRGGSVYFTPEDIERSNGSADFGIIDTRFNLGEFSLESPEEEDFGVKFSVDSASLALKSNLRINFTTRWFSLKRFECVLYGQNSFDIATSVTGSASSSFKDDVEITKFNCFTTVFMIGIVPVSVSCDVGLQAVYELSATASATFSTNYNIKDTYELGALYDDGTWYSIANSKRESGFTDYYFSPVAVDLVSMFGLELFADLKFYGCVGPKVTFGPHVEANVSAAHNALEEQIDFSTTGTLSLGGKYGVELKIWKWKLAAFMHEYNAVKPIELWNFEESIPDEILDNI